MLIITSSIRKENVPFVNVSDDEANRILAQAIGEELLANYNAPAFRKIAREYASGYGVLYVTLHTEPSVL